MKTKKAKKTERLLSDELVRSIEELREKIRAESGEFDVCQDREEHHAAAPVVSGKRKKAKRLLSDEEIACIDRLAEAVRAESGAIDVVALVRRDRDAH